MNFEAAKDSGMTDLRKWLAEAEAAGEVQTVDGAHWELEIGALSQVNYRRSHPKALMFDGIKDYARGSRVLSGSVSNPRLLGSVLGLGWDNTDEDLVEKLAVKPGEWIESRTRVDRVGGTLAFADCTLAVGEREIVRARAVWVVAG